MRKTALSLAALLMIAGNLIGHKIETYDGRRFDVDKFKFENNTVVYDTLRLDRNQIKSVVFEHMEAVESAETLSSGDLSRVFEDYKAKAEQLQQQYEDSYGIILKDHGVFRQDDTGTEVMEYHFAGKILKTRAQGWANVSVSFDEERELVKVKIARSIAEDGTVKDLDPATIKIASPTRYGDFFGKQKVLSFNIPQASLGSIIEYKYEKITFDPEEPGLWSPQFFFQSTAPVADSRLVVELPIDKELYFKTYNFPDDRIQPEKSTTDSTRIYCWNLQDLPPIIEERFMPGMGDIVPQVMTSLYPDYDFYFNYFGKLHKGHLEVTPEIADLAGQVTAGITSVTDKVAALYHFVERNIRYVSIKGSLSSGYAGHPSAHTLKNKYGDCIDKAILFAALLKAVDIEAYPIVLMTNFAGQVDRSFPNYLGNHAINEVWIDGEKYILDATSNVHRFPSFSDMDKDVTYVNFVTGRIDTIPEANPEENFQKTEMTMQIDRTGNTEVKIHEASAGDYEAMMRGSFERIPEQFLDNLFARFLNSRFAGAKLDNYGFENLREISMPFEMDYAFTIAKYPIFAGDLMIFNVPNSRMGFPEIALEERKYDIVMGSTYRNSVKAAVKIPEGYKVEYLPEEFEMKNRYITYRASYAGNGNGTINYEYTFDRNKRTVPVEDYERYKEDLEKIITYTNKQIILVPDI